MKNMVAFFLIITENIGPEENTTTGTHPKGETQQPLERGLVAPLEPPRLFDFGGGEDQEAREYGGGDYKHREAMERKNGSQ